MLMQMISRIRRRLQLERVLKGVALVAVLLLAGSILASLLLTQYNFSDDAIFWIRIVGSISILFLLFNYLLRPTLSPPSRRQIARFLEERHPELQERLSTAVELEKTDSPVHPEIRRLVQRDARDKFRRLPRPRLYFPRASASSLAAVLIAALTFLVLFFSGPMAYQYSLARLFKGWDDESFKPLYSIEVTPGHVRIGKHADLEVRARLTGFDAEKTLIYVKYQNEPQWQEAQMEVDPAGAGSVFIFFDVRDQFDYYVEADGIVSDVFQVAVSEIPRVVRLTVDLEFPAYAGLSPVQQEDDGDIRALIGTVARFNIETDQPVQAGKIKLDLGAETEIALTQLDPRHLTGELKVETNDFYRVHLQDLEEVWSPASDEYLIEALQDQPPILSFTAPGRDRKVTNLEEVFLEAKAEDDYGVTRMVLRYSLNGDEEQEILLDHPRRSKSFQTSYTFFMEEYNLQPGDFVSYYARAEDAVSNSTTDIYFLEVDPFDKEYSQAQAGQGGQAGADIQLARQQKQIIAATFKLERDRKELPKEDLEENSQTLALVQQQLQIQAQTIIERIERRGAAASDPRFKKMVEYLTEAMTHMEGAHEELNRLATKEALPFEQKSYQNLLRAEALFNEIQVAFGNDSNSGASAEDLADLVDLELDKKKNQYETLQQNRSEQQEQKLDEALQKLKELAQRQEQQNERARRQAQRGNSSGGSSNQEQLIEEAEKLARELERLSRQKRDQKLSQVASQLRQAARDMRKAQSGGKQQQDAQMRAQQALERLQKARRELDQHRQGQMQNTVEDLKRQAENLIQNQEEVVEKVDDLKERIESGKIDQEFLKQRRELDRLKTDLMEDVQGLEGDLHQTARRMTSKEPASAKKLKEAAHDIRDERIADQMEEGHQFMMRGWFDQARTREKGVARELDKLAEKIDEAEQALGSGKGSDPRERLQQAQNELGRLVENLESLKERADASQQQGESGQEGQGERPRDSQQPGDSQGREQGEQGQNPQGQPSDQGEPSETGQPSEQGQQPGSQPGQQSEQQGQQRGQSPGSQQSQDGRPQGSEPRGGQANSDSVATRSGPTSNSSGINPRQIGRELEEREKDLARIRRLLREDPRLARDVNQMLSTMRRLDAERLFNDPRELARLKAQVIDGLHQLELEINQALEESAEGRLRLANSDEIPPRYRRNVEEYYRSLAKKKK